MNLRPSHLIAAASLLACGHYETFAADAAASSARAAEWAHVKMAPRAIPDLRVEETIPGEPAYDQRDLVIPVTVVIFNRGLRHAGAFRVSMTLSPEGARRSPEAVPFVVDDRPARMSALRAMTIDRLTGIVRIRDPRKALAGRKLHLRATVDSAREVNERNEADNQGGAIAVIVPSERSSDGLAADLPAHRPAAASTPVSKKIEIDPDSVKR